MKKTFIQKNGITLIALVITIIVLLILAGITIATLSGENGILQRATNAKTGAERARIIEKARTDILSKITDNKGAQITKEQLVSILNSYFKSIEPNEIPDEISSTDDIKLTTIDEKYIINLSEIFNGNLSKENDGTSKVSVNDLRAGDEVYYTLKNSSTPIECVVLWDSTSAYGQNGVQIITKDSIAKVILGNEILANSVESYNNAIQTLNNKAKEYLNLELSPEKVEINGSFISAARCVGSVPDNPTFESGYREKNFEGYQVKNKDSNCTKDLEQMNNLGIKIAENNSDYWLASRYIFSYNSHDSYGINGVSKTGDIDLNGFKVLFDTYGPTQSYTVRSFECEQGFRPVFTLKKDIQIKKVPQITISDLQALSQSELKPMFVKACQSLGAPYTDWNDISNGNDDMTIEDAFNSSAYIASLGYTSAYDFILKTKSYK